MIESDEPGMTRLISFMKTLNDATISDAGSVIDVVRLPSRRVESWGGAVVHHPSTLDAYGRLTLLASARMLAASATDNFAYLGERQNESYPPLASLDRLSHSPSGRLGLKGR